MSDKLHNSHPSGTNSFPANHTPGKCRNSHGQYGSHNHIAWNPYSWGFHSHGQWSNNSLWNVLMLWDNMLQSFNQVRDKRTSKIIWCICIHTLSVLSLFIFYTMKTLLYYWHKYLTHLMYAPRFYFIIWNSMHFEHDYIAPFPLAFEMQLLLIQVMTCHQRNTNHYLNQCPDVRMSSARLLYLVKYPIIVL